jgi:hypothetical protein
MPRPHRTFWASVALLALAVPAVHAQKPEQGSNSPNPPYPPVGSTNQTGESGVGTSQEQGGEDPISAPPLTGVQDFVLVGPRVTHSFFQPTIGVFEVADTNPPGGLASSREVVPFTSAYANFRLQKNSSRSQFALNYLAGGTVAHGQNGLNSVVQLLSFNQTINWRRWNLLVTGQFSYLPESSFGGGEGGGAWQPPDYFNLASSFIPNQSIYTSRGGRVSNITIGQVEYSASPRGSLTFSGGYGILRFLETDLLNSGMAIGSAGYSYRVSRHDSLGVIYRYTGVRFGSLDRAIDAHDAHLAYGRNLTGRLVFRVSAGPEFRFVRDPGAAVAHGVYWGLDSSLQYGLRRTSLTLSYHHAISGGAGVFAGAETDQVGGAIDRSLTRMWIGTVGIGYAKNHALDVGSLDSSGRRFNTWYGRVKLSRPIGRTAGLSLEYNIQLQNTNVPVCIGPSCGRAFLRHLITLGFWWNPGPLVIE